MASVSLSGISKRFGGVVAVDGLDLEVRDHEFMSFLGPSGCGKTTTLNMIAGLEAPSAGSIRIGDSDVTAVPAMGRDIVRAPKVFLLDEPLSNLDAVLRVQTRAELRRLFQRLQTTTIYVTYDQAEAMTMSDRI